MRGMRVDEALQAVMYFIDDAIQVGVGRVRIYTERYGCIAPGYSRIFEHSKWGEKLSG